MDLHSPVQRALAAAGVKNLPVEPLVTMLRGHVSTSTVSHHIAHSVMSIWLWTTLPLPKANSSSCVNDVQPTPVFLLSATLSGLGNQHEPLECVCSRNPATLVLFQTYKRPNQESIITLQLFRLRPAPTERSQSR